LWDSALRRGLRAPSFRLVRDGATLSSAATCRRAGIGHRTIDDVIQPNRVLELHAAGASMVLQGLQFSEPHLGRTANNLALDLGHAVQVNAYLSPAAAKGLELHFDYHDVFVLQLDGAKRWRVWEPLERTRLPVRSGRREPMPTFGELGEPTMDLTVQAGDCLYLPRGFPHAAETIDSASSHLTIGIIAPTWQQAVRRAVDEAVAAGDLRESIAVDVRGLPGSGAEPIGEATNHDGRSFGCGAAEADRDGASSLTSPRKSLEALVPHLDPLALRRWMTQEVWRRQPATRLRPLHAPAIGLDTRLVVTPGPLLWLTAVGDRVELGLGDRTLTMPAEAGDLLDAILRSRQPFALGTLDVRLDAASRLVVGERLAAEGVVAPG
jgi:bifunctional lysine-specific demethylase and histidyl-hydroxylase NO66